MTPVFSTVLGSVHVKIKNKLERSVTSLWHCILDFNTDSLFESVHGTLLTVYSMVMRRVPCQRLCVLRINLIEVI